MADTGREPSPGAFFAGSGRIEGRYELASKPKLRLSYTSACRHDGGMSDSSSRPFPAAARAASGGGEGKGDVA
jgi:hypothetical protein